MRRYQLLAAVGALLIVAGFALLLQPPALAQDGDEPPFLAEIFAEWMGSAHAKADAEAFVHWDSEGEIPVECAKCHSTPGYQDYLGADGSEFRVVDAPAPIGTVVTCDACHNSVASGLNNVLFPSGVLIEGTGVASRCMECHQGRASMESVDAAIAEAGLAEDGNAVSEELGFINIHYYAAAATLYGSQAHGGYQYAGMAYQGKNAHVPEFDTCTECHNQHTLQVKLDECATCHEDVSTLEDLRFIRMAGSGSDYDGDGDNEEGIADEITGLQELLYEAIQAYASEVAGAAILYDAASYPYFFIDTNGNGDADEGEVAFPNAYKSWTGNLLKAAYNYQVTMKDPGGFAHNPKYHIQLLYDSILSLNESISDPVDLEEAQRNDPGHFDGTAEAFRHWDEDGEVPGSCARCHTAGGLPTFLKNSANIAAPPSDSLACSTCHDLGNDFELYVSNTVRFPSGATVSFGEDEPANLCLNCHQGRESTTSVNAAIQRAGVGDDEVTDKLTFRNVHYFAAGATLFGTEVKGAYEFEGKEYNGRNMHVEEADTCIECHQQHDLVIRVNRCADCHEEVDIQEDTHLIRLEQEDVEPVDYDGDGDDAEPIRDEILSFQEALLVALQAYAADTAGTAIAYDAHTHPYWYTDTNGNGTADEDEVNSDNRYVTWTPNLLRAAYNYQYSQKDPGTFAHNPNYMMQVLYDSIEAIGGDVSAFTRPEVGS
ncbi:MAG: hypothetical protein IT323_02495 [Anaerolineae bacterium]|nr:hypothetical protein [Anaerolineae bacterium]